MADRRNSLSEDDITFGYNPIDDLRLRVNTARPTAEQVAAGRNALAMDALSIIPGPGNALAAYDAYQGGKDTYNALAEGQYKRASLNGLLSVLSGIGAVTGLPVGRFAKQAATAGKDALYAIPAWHGSPHDFDKFELNKIGTGEGAQTYGHGLYFAENPTVAKSYQALSKDVVPPYKDIVAREFPDIAAISDDAAKQLYMKSIHTAGTAKEAATLVQSNTPAFAKIPRERLAAALERLRDAKKGRLYRTELDVEPEDLLDWDKPLSQQSEKVQAAVRKLSDANPNQFRKDEINRWLQSDGDFFSGSRLYDVLQSDFGGREELTRAFRKAGIPGIRYLDQGSRGAGQGSSNYVIFDDSLVKILSKE